MASGRSRSCATPPHHDRARAHAAPALRARAPGLSATVAGYQSSTAQADTMVRERLATFDPGRRPAS